jgi:hypothetical protein
MHISGIGTLAIVGSYLTRIRTCLLLALANVLLLGILNDVSTVQAGSSNTLVTTYILHSHIPAYYTLKCIGCLIDWYKNNYNFISYQHY